MKITCTVHGFTEEAVPTTVTLNGREVQATVPGLCVELVSDAGCWSLKTVPGDMDKARALFAPGAEVVATFSAGAAK